MIAEILLQHIDKEILQNLQTKGLSMPKDFRVFRYVDDIYIFANTPIITDTIVKTIVSTAQKYLLHLNELKYYTTETPVVLNDWIDKTRAFADKVSGDFLSAKVESEDISYLCSEDGNGNTTGKTDNDGIGNEFDDSSQFKHS